MSIAGRDRYPFFDILARPLIFEALLLSLGSAFWEAVLVGGRLFNQAYARCFQSSASIATESGMITA